MYKKMFYGLSLVALSMVLCSCAHFFQRESPALAKRNECINLRRNLLFLDANRGDQEQWQLQKQRDIIQREYAKKDCDRILGR